MVLLSLPAQRKASPSFLNSLHRCGGKGEVVGFESCQRSNIKNRVSLFDYKEEFIPKRRLKWGCKLFF